MGLPIFELKYHSRDQLQALFKENITQELTSLITTVCAHGIFINGAIWNETKYIR